MYLQFFGFSSSPFSDTPDVRLFWEDHCSQVIFKSLLQRLIDHSRLQLVIAEPGLGKSVLCRRLLNSLRSHRSRYEVVYVAFPNVTAIELLNSALSSPTSGRRKVLIIDEAQALPERSLLKLVKLLQCKDDNKRELQMVFFAQPELYPRFITAGFEMAESSEFVSYELLQLSEDQTAAYINNRLKLTGVAPETLMSQDLAGLAFRLTGGVPRLINTLMRKSLLLASEEQSRVLIARHLQQAASTTAASVPDSVY